MLQGRICGESANIPPTMASGGHTSPWVAWFRGQGGIGSGGCGNQFQAERDHEYFRSVGSPCILQSKTMMFSTSARRARKFSLYLFSYTLKTSAINGNLPRYSNNMR